VSSDIRYCVLAGRLVIIGFGSIGQGSLPLILRHIGITPDRITIVTGDNRGQAEAAKYGVKFVTTPLTPDNFRHVLEGMVGAGDFVLNLSVEVSSIAMIEYAREMGAMYLDTCIEPWPGAYTDTTKSLSERSNYALRERALALKGTGGPTAVVTHGANPGLVSHFVKQALLNLAADADLKTAEPKTREAWAALARQIGVKVVHIAERDSQVANQPKRRGEFVNTWSIDGFVSEGCQPAELGWGSHEKGLPPDGAEHAFGCGSAIYLKKPGTTVKVRTWTPIEGPFQGFLITHSEAISIADYYSVVENGKVVYRPTSHYAYHPCDDAVTSVHEFVGKNFEQQSRQRLLMNEIIDGVDELGVLLAGHARNAYWFGSQLSVAEARELAPYNNATSLQVCVAVLAGMVWAVENPGRGVVEPEEMDFRRCLEICLPYLGPVGGFYSDWTPLVGRGHLFPEDVDTSDPWQFKNIRVA
jgi:homospermidine synthase